MRTVAFSFEAMTEFFQSDLDDVCSSYDAAYKQCQNSAITNLSQCMSLTLYNQYQQAQDTWVYGWFSYDNVANNMAYNYCKQSDSSFTFTLTEFVESFSFDYGYVSCDGKQY
jgi:hypothetical protein